MVAVILAMVGLSVAVGIRWEFVTSLIGGFLRFDRSNLLVFCFSSGTGIGISFLLYSLGHDLDIWGVGTSCVLEMLDGLETNKFTVMEEVEGHVVIALIGLDMVGEVVLVVVTVIVGINVTGALNSTRGFSINLNLYCLLFAW